MKKNPIFWTLACLIGLVLVLPGCDQAPKKAATPKIVRKKIEAKTAQKADAPDAKVVASAKPEPAAEKESKPKPPVEPKSDISTVRPPGTAQPDVQTGSEQKTLASASPEATKPSASKMPPIYDPKGKIDPFEPLFKETPEVALVKKERKKRAPRTPLERIDIGQLKLVGIILAESGNKALVEEASGKGYIVKVGTYLGTNSGKVVTIEKDKVIVAEEYEDVLGNVTLRNTEIKLPKPPGEL